MPRAATDNPDPIDVHAGQTVRARRLALGYTQSDLAKQLGLSFQQVQKYERGTNRISASMLFRMAAFMGCQPGDFFPAVADVAAGAHQVDASLTLASVRGGHALAQAFLRMDSVQRVSLVNVAQAISPPPALVEAA